VRRAVFENFKDTLRIIIDFRVLYENLMKKISTINEFQQPEWCNLAQLYQLKKIIEAIILEKDLKGIQSDIQHLA
jgi:hypothetical protein